MSTDSGAKWYQSSAGIGTSSIDDLLGEADLALRSDGGSSPSWAAGGNNCNSAFGTLPSRASAASSSASSSLEFGTPRPPTTVRASANVGRTNYSMIGYLCVWHHPKNSCFSVCLDQPKVKIRIYESKTAYDRWCRCHTQ
jgi:hypothetical protein